MNGENKIPGVRALSSEKHGDVEGRHKGPEGFAFDFQSDVSAQLIRRNSFVDDTFAIQIRNACAI